MATPSRPLERILVLNLNQIGAVLLAMPVLHALKQAHPGAKVVTLVHDRMIPLLENNPDCDEAIGWNKKWGWKQKLNAIKRLRDWKFDAAVNLSHARSRAFLTFYSGAPLRVGFDSSSAAFLHNIIVPEPQAREHPSYHETRRKLDLARALGDFEGDMTAGFALFPTEQERLWAESVTREAGVEPDDVLIGLNPGASNPLNQWEPNQFARLSDLLAERGYKVAILGGPMDKEAGEEILASVTKPVLAWTARFNFRELAAILERTTVLVTADTGPMHMAVGTRTPLVGPFGPADPLWTGPYCGRGIVLQREELPCIRCLKYTCHYSEEKACLRGMEPEQVLAAVEKLVARRHEPVAANEMPVIRQPIQLIA